ncbi:MAG: hypothetical protein KGJ07_09770, partial [Patescibacteria group bacterium]|nr:hypothetical protein [Patescibacteria group bacterium]
MKKLFFILIIIATSAYVFYARYTQSPKMSSLVSTAQPQRMQIPTPGITTNERILFVPYWTLSSDIQQNAYDTFIYFGITPGNSGINVSDQGYVNIPTFIAKVSPAKTLLTIRMTDKAMNEKILDSPSFQKQIIYDSLFQAKRYGFKGLLLDFEAGGIGFDSLTNQVTGFITDFAKEAKKQKTFFSVAVYADTFYRARPYDIKKIAAQADNMIVMAYDF